MLAARSLGERFAIVTIWPMTSRPLYHRLLTQTGMADKCASVVYTIDSEPASGHAGLYDAMEANEASLIERVERSCRRAFEEDGADTVVLGCTCMHPIAGALARRFDRPVLDPVMVGWRFAELAVEASASRTRPAGGVPGEHRDAFHALLAGAPATRPPDDCERCEIASVTS